jgi:phosphoribosylformimino-5-aminoimidazole carboxamide ribonucleotide (ProFAR) isomerase
MCTFVKRRLQYQNYLQRKSVRSAKEFEAHGIEYLHLVDLDGAKSSQIVNYNIGTNCNTNKSKIDFAVV